MTESYLNEEKSIKVLNEFSFDGWTKNYAFDEQSISIGINSPLAQYQRSAIFYNEINADKVIDVSAKDYYDLEGKNIKILQLLPFTSTILLYK